MRWVQRRTMGFSRRCALVASANGAWAIRVSSAGEMGCGVRRARCEGHEIEREENEGGIRRVGSEACKTEDDVWRRG